MSQPALPRVDIDLRPPTPAAVPDQGSRPVCLPMAATGAHNVLAAVKGEAPRSMEALWWGASRLHQSPMVGTTTTHIGQALSRTGQPDEARWPYPQSRLDPTAEEPPPQCATPPWRTATLTTFAARDHQFEQRCESHLADGKPVVLIIQVTDEFYAPKSDGTIAIPPARAKSYGNHAVLVMGLLESQTGERHLLIRNSWGPMWGDAGYGLLPLGYLPRHGVEAAVVLDESS